MSGNIQKPGAALLARIKRYLLAGIGVILPLFITLYVVLLLFKFADGIAGRYINSFLLERYGFSVPGLGMVILVTVIIITGMVSSLVITRRIFPFFERLLLRLPFVAYIYPSVKRLSNFFFETSVKNKYKKVVLVEYPQDGSFSIGFITNENLPRLSQKSGQPLVSVYVPLAPTPFSGFILLVPRRKIEVLNMSVEQAVKFIVSGGVIAPGETT